MARPMVRTGDAITLVVTNSRAVVHDFAENHIEGASVPGFLTTASHACRYEGEGVTWLRGHLTPDAEEVVAARAAQALRSSALSTRDEGDDKPAFGGTFGGSKALLGSLVGAAIGGMIGGTFDKKKGPTK